MIGDLYTIRSLFINSTHIIRSAIPAWVHNVDCLPGKWANHNNKVWLKSMMVGICVAEKQNSEDNAPYSCVLISTGKLYWFNTAYLFKI